MEANIGRAGVAGAVAVVLALSGCTGGGSSDATGGESTPPPEVRREEQPTIRPAWTLGSYLPMSLVEATDGGFVLYALEGGDLSAIGVDAATGEVRWQHPANRSWIVPGVGLHIAVADGLAVFLSADTPAAAEAGYVQVVAVDAATGERQWVRTDSMAVLDHPAFCGDDRDQVCLVGSEGEDWLWTVLDRRTGREVAATRVEDGRALSDRLFPVENGTALARIDLDGTTSWQRPVGELFGTPDVSPNQGWHIRNQDGRYVGSLGGEWDEVSDNVARRELGDEVLAAFDEATGEPLWAEAGTFWCSGFQITLEHPVRCRSTGLITAEEPDSVTRPYGGYALEGDITVEGFDPATGESRWVWEAGEVPGLAFHHESVRAIGDTTYLVATVAGEVLLDIATGNWEPVADPLPGWCTEDVVRGPELQIQDGYQTELRVPEWWPCQPDGTALELPATVPDFAGARAGDVFAWVGQSELRAVHVGDSADPPT